MQRMTRAQQQQQTKEMLFTAAMEQITKFGFEKTSINSITEAAGFSKGAFFSNFENKYDLLLQLTEKLKDEERTLLKSSLNINDKKHTISTNGLNAYFDHIKNNTACVILDIEMQLIASRDPQFKSFYYQFQQENNKALGEIICKVFAFKGVKPSLSPESLAQIFIALTEGLLLQNVDNPGKQIKAILEALIEKDNKNLK
ncbi:TetR/AcrR family transcriptional regulator [Gilliamella sp. wkB112]|uniref:TetR/AcrR family transcriptional regulator n=1 Tax=Gilliamella sp. wkB112 TaxID=3120257 RepID=UPI00080ED25E|nr:TetR/AcrR family transcriptional regulator [Gilliamella apicola]OCG00778.1 hypothetical protein A9G12_03165 [Gilliamella apicola]